MKFSYCFLLISSVLFAQSPFPRDYFRSPLDIPMALSGNFGELRPNHFHAGFDMKTLQKEGLNVYAAADGYVSRIKISTFGNGKTIYIDHPNGYTTVYAHLQKATDSIEALIKKTHYAERAFEIEIYPKTHQLPIKKGQLIALSGNSGASEGPHLHFEIRDTKTEKIINPMFFGFDSFLKDSKKPIVSKLYAYALDSNGVVNNSQGAVAVNLSLQKDGTYLADKVKSNGKIGFGLVSYDYDDVSFNRNGLFNVNLSNGDKSVFSYQFNTYAFDEMRYVNAFIDYARYRKTGVRVQKLFMNPPYNLSILKSDSSYGVISPDLNRPTSYLLQVSDFYGNTTSITIPVEYAEFPSAVLKPELKSDYFVKASKDCAFESNKCSVFFPAGTFYSDFYLNFEVSDNIMSLHEDTVPAHSNFVISMPNNGFASGKKDKVFIARVSGNSLSYNSTKETANGFEARVRTLGKYKLAMDTIAPRIKVPASIQGKRLDNLKKLQISISDNMSGIGSYNGYLNGKWILMEYDNKTGILTHDFDDGIVEEGDNLLRVNVIDNVGNISSFETHFQRSKKP